MKLIAIFMGNTTRDIAAGHLNSIGNAMNLDSISHTAYDDLQ